MQGILNVYKPAGCTSRDVVNQIQRLVRPAKVGHAGTLDPLATGVLVVCIGQATRLIEYIQRMPKHYIADFLLGYMSASDDTETDLIELESAPHPSRRQIEEMLLQFLGVIEQSPPAYSAVKIDGRRAYELARQGRPQQITPRTVRVDKLVVRRYEYPELQLEIVCGSGTYVRSLGRDLAQALGTGGVMSGLQRTAIGAFCVQQALDPRDVSQQEVEHALLPLSAAVGQLPRVELTADQIRSVRHGRPLSITDEIPGAEIAGFDERGNLIAILQSRTQHWVPSPNFAPSIRSLPQ